MIIFILYGCKEVPPLNHGGMEFVIDQYCQAFRHFGLKIRLLWEEKILDENYQEISDWKLDNADTFIFGNTEQLKIFKDKWGNIPKNSVHLLHWRSTSELAKVVSPSRYTSFLPRMQGKNVLRIPHPLFLDYEDFDKRYDPFIEENISNKYNLPKDYLFCAARVCKFKNVDRAISIARSIKKTLVWAGPVEDKKLLKRIQDTGNIYLGDIPRTEVIGLMKSSLAVLCLTKYFPAAEAYGLFQVEALLAGSKVISSGSGGLIDTIYNPNVILYPNFIPTFLLKSFVKKRLKEPTAVVSKEYINEFSGIKAGKKFLKFINM